MIIKELKTIESRKRTEFQVLYSKNGSSSTYSNICINYGTSSNMFIIDFSEVIALIRDIKKQQTNFTLFHQKQHKKQNKTKNLLNMDLILLSKV